MTIGIISGATRKGRNSVRVARHLEGMLENREEVERVHFMDISEYNFPNYVDGQDRSEELLASTKKFSDNLFDSDAIILVSPEYNGGMAGSLKNALDYFRKEYERRPFGLVSVSAGTMGGINAMHQMVDFVSYVGGWLCGKRLLVSQVQNTFDQNGQIVSDQFNRNSAGFVDELITFTKVVRTTESMQG